MPPKKTTPKTTAPAAKPATPIAAKPVATPATPISAPVVERSEAKGSGTAAKPAKAAPREITHEMIARRAFEIYAGRGYAPGDPTADWLEAERQLKAGL
jgi:hypothetical protein